MTYAKNPNSNEASEHLSVYCERLSKRNNSILYKLEEYLGQKLLCNDELKEIRDIVLSVSADIKNLHKIIPIERNDE